MKKKSLTNKTRGIIAGYLFISLWLIGLLIFTMWPLIQAVFYSFNEVKFSGSSLNIVSNGFITNYVYAFGEDLIFPALLKSYLASILVQVPFLVTMALILAMLLNRKMKMRTFFRVIFFLPVIISTGPVIKELMNQGATTLPQVASSSMTSFLEDYLPTFISVPISLLLDNLIIVLWYTGIPVLIMLAGLQRIDKSSYEAAYIDGASSWQCFWKVTLSSMKSFILVSVIYSIVTLSFSGIPVKEGEQTILDYMQYHMISVGGLGYGYACTLGIIFFIAILLQIGLWSLLLMPRERRRK